MFIKLLIITIILLLLSLIFFGLRILLKSGGRFPETHVGHNKEMRKRGITCAQDANTGCNISDETGSCSACGNNITGS
jgi:hypothetical protein